MQLAQFGLRNLAIILLAVPGGMAFLFWFAANNVSHGEATASAAVDCGVAINPDVIAAQVEGAIGFALSAVLRNQVTFANGVVEQGNFDDYEPTRIKEMPAVEVHIVKSAEAPTGIGEPGLPPLAPAIGNAMFAATGKRIRSLPFDLGSLA